MKHTLTTFVCFVGIAFAETLPLPDGSSVDLPTVSEEESKAFMERERQEREAAIARLPVLDEQRMEEILVALRDIKYPLSLDALKVKLGGPGALVWCCDHVRLHESFRKQTSTFTVARMSPDLGTYVLVVDFTDAPIDGPSTSVWRARLCYESPFGWRFAAESIDDRLGVGSREKEPNQALQPTPMLVTPRADARVAPSTGVADL